MNFSNVAEQQSVEFRFRFQAWFGDFIYIFLFRPPVCKKMVEQNENAKSLSDIKVGGAYGKLGSQIVVKYFQTTCYIFVCALCNGVY